MKPIRPAPPWDGTDVNEGRRLIVGLFAMNRNIGEDPGKFLPRVDRMVKGLDQEERPIDLKDADIVIVRELTCQYTTEVTTLL